MTAPESVLSEAQLPKPPNITSSTASPKTLRRRSSEVRKPGRERMMRRLEKEIPRGTYCWDLSGLELRDQIGGHMNIRPHNEVKRDPGVPKRLGQADDRGPDSRRSVVEHARRDVWRQAMVPIPSATAMLAILRAVAKLGAPSSVPGKMWV